MRVRKIKKYKAILQFDEENLVQTYLDNSGCTREDLPRLDSAKIDISAIVEEEINWLNQSGIKIIDVSEVNK